jgi:hypothetical protein
MKADWATAALLLQMLAITDCTFVASLPQTLSRSAGLGSVLTAARRQAGGVARTEVVERARRARRVVMVREGMMGQWPGVAGLESVVCRGEESGVMVVERGSKERGAKERLR